MNIVGGASPATTKAHHFMAEPTTVILSDLESQGLIRSGAAMSSVTVSGCLLPLKQHSFCQAHLDFFTFFSNCWFVSVFLFRSLLPI